MRNLVFISIAIGLLTGLAFLARRLYRMDAMGARTAMAKRYPENREGQDLSGQDLQGAFLPYAKFNRAKLYETMLSRTNLQFADLTEANLDMAGLDETDFSHAILHKAKLENARWLESAIYRHTSFRDTDLTAVSFQGLYGRHQLSKPKHMMDPVSGGADMTGAIFDGARCHRTIFRRCLLTGASFKNADCRDADFSHADLRNADFTGADLTGANFTGAIRN